MFTYFCPGCFDIILKNLRFNEKPSLEFILFNLNKDMLNLNKLINVEH